MWTHRLFIFYHVCMCVLAVVLSACLWPHGYSLPGSCVHIGFQSKNTGSALTQGLNPSLLRLCIGFKGKVINTAPPGKSVLHHVGGNQAVFSFSLRGSVLISKPISPQSCELAMLERHILRRIASNIWASIFTEHCAMQLHVSSQLRGVYVGGLGKSEKVSWIVETKVCYLVDQQ